MISWFGVVVVVVERSEIVDEVRVRRRGRRLVVVGVVGDIEDIYVPLRLAAVMVVCVDTCDFIFWMSVGRRWRW